MKKFKILSLVLMLMVGVVCFGGCDLFNRDNTFEVLGNSMYPTLKMGDKVVVEERDNYVVGDIVVFNATVPIVTRIIGITTEGETTYYICHGDNIQNVDGSMSPLGGWEDDATFVQDLIDAGKTKEEIQQQISTIIQIVAFDQIKGAVIKVI